MNSRCNEREELKKIWKVELFFSHNLVIVVLQAKEILFTKRLLNGYMSEYTDQPTDKIEVCVMPFACFFG